MPNLVNPDNDEIDLDETSESKVVTAVDDSLLELICAPLLRPKPMGLRHLWLGDSGMGKTIANEELLKWIHKKKLVDLTLTIDDKNAHEVQYSGGCERINPNHLRGKPPSGDENARHIVFRGIAATKRPGPDVDEVIFDTTQMAWDLVRDDSIQILLNIDELADATNGYQGWKQPEVASLYRKGRSCGLSVVATTQLPQELPRATFGLSETIGLFRMTGNEVLYLVKKGVIPESEADAISTLEIGEFRMFVKSRPLDPKTYRFEI